MGRQKGERPLGHKPSRPTPIGMKLVGFCKDCKLWDRMECPIVIMTECDDDDHITPPGFGCVRWEAEE